LAYDNLGAVSKKIYSQCISSENYFSAFRFIDNPFVKAGIDIPKAHAPKTNKENTISIAFCDPGPLRFCIPKFSMEFPDTEIHYNRFEETGHEIELLLNGINDIVCVSKSIEHDDVTCVHFIKDCLFMSVPAARLPAKEKTVSLKKIKPLSIMQPNPDGNFLVKQKQFWKSFHPDIKMIPYDDPAVLNQILRNTNGIH
jgi:hypothetical protein